MLNSPRILIASAYGRGHWIAVELLRFGFSVQLIDVTSHLGKTLPEDQDGPFGYFHSPQWQGVESEMLQSFGSVREAEQGFSVWLKSGPWELRGPSFQYRAESLGQQERVLNFVRHLHDINLERKSWVQKIGDLDFDQRWFASLACDFMSNESQWPNKAYQRGAPTAMLEKYFSRPPETRNQDSSLKWCEEQGVSVLSDCEIPDIAIESGKVKGIEVKSSGFTTGHQLIWTLTSAETSMFSPKIFSKVFKGSQIDPEWCWLRFGIEFEESLESQYLPNEFLFIEDLSTPWTHDNLAIFRRGNSKQKFHVWLRIPFSQRFHNEYLSERILPLGEKLIQRCARLKIKNMDLPLEASIPSKNLGAPLYPIFREEDLIHPPGVSLSNLWYSQPERWPSYSMGSIFSSQAKMVFQLKQWWGSLSEEQKQKELQA